MNNIVKTIFLQNMSSPEISEDEKKMLLETLQENNPEEIGRALLEDEKNVKELLEKHKLETVVYVPTSKKKLLEITKNNLDKYLNNYTSSKYKNLNIVDNFLYLNDIDLSGLDLSGINLKGVILKNANLKGTNLEGADLEEAEFLNVNFNEASILGAKLNLVKAMDSNFTDCNLSGSYMLESTFTNSQFQDAIIRGADFGDSKFFNCSFTKAVCSESNFSPVELNRCLFEDTNFKRANLEYAKFNETGIFDTDFECANLKSSRFKDCEFDKNYFANTNLTDANLSGAYLEKCAFLGANLQDANFEGTILDVCQLDASYCGGINLFKAKQKYTEFTCVNFQNANLQRANFNGANLERADLQGAKLQGAKLKDSILDRANLDNADLTNADLRAVKLDFASLEGATLINVDLTDGATLRSTYLHKANLTGAEITNGDLERSHITEAILTGANFTGSNIDHVDFNSSNFDEAFSDTNPFVPSNIWEHKFGRMAFNKYPHLSREGVPVENLNLNLINKTIKDVVMQEEVTIDEYLSNPDPYGDAEYIRGPIVVLLNEQKKVMRIDSLYIRQLNELLENVETHMFECKGRRIEIEDEDDPEKYDKAIANLNGTIAGDINKGHIPIRFEYIGLIPIDQLTTVLNMHTNEEGVVQPFIMAIQPVGEFSHVMSYQMSFGPIYNNMESEGIGAYHCQYGSNQTVYKIYLVDL